MVLYNTPEERRITALRYGSPLFSYKNSQLTTGSQDIIDFEQIPKAQKYLPFNFLQITNNSEDEITIYFDCDTTQAKVIPKGVIMTFENIYYRRILYKNTGSTTISANKIEFIGQLLPVKDEYAKPQLPLIQRIKLFLGVE
jgi:hypothetical protein